ncbi:MAG: gamma-glutamyltransferase family protein [Pseudomonadota bacterium]
MSQTFTTRPEVRGTFGAVSSTHWLGSAVGFGILERGGNAFDAAVATGFVLQIVEPHLNGPGGEVPILFHAAGAARPRVLCGQGVAPQAATIDRLLGEGIDRMPGTGLVPAVVPGAFDAWMLLLRDYGTMRLSEVLDPTIGYAESGFPLAYRAAASIHAGTAFFQREWPTSAAVWTPGGTPPRPGARFATPAIAKTYRRVLAEAEAAGTDRDAQIEAAREAFYRGFVAEAIDRSMQTPISDGLGEHRAGLLTADDMAGWRGATYEDTISVPIGDVSVHKAGPWSQGPAFLQSLRLLEGVDLEDMDRDGPGFVHWVVETMKLALADRDAFLGDPDHVDVPLERLLSVEYAAERRASIGDAASMSFRPGAATPDWAERRDTLLSHVGDPAPPAGIGLGEPTFADVPEVEGDTVHLDVVDRWGNLVSATPSGGWLQSSPAVAELGFSVTTRGQMFWLDPSLPGALGPGRRPRTTLTPTLITRDGQPYLGIGTPGGDQQEQWTLSTFLRIFQQRLTLQAAIDAPQFHTAHYISSFFPRGFTPGVLHIEDRFPEATRRALAERGHVVMEQPGWTLGRVCAAGFADGMVRAAATPRYMQAYAVGR